MKKVLIIAASVFAVFMVLALAFMPADSDGRVDGSNRPVISAGEAGSGLPAPTTTADPPAYIPVPTDIIIVPAITEQQCFGSAGCNVTFKINVTYNGKLMYPGEGPYTVTFRVDGSEDALIGSFVLTPKDGGQVDYTAREYFVSTESADVPLTIVVTAVS